jgi:hypothetical protein
MRTAKDARLGPRPAAASSCHLRSAQAFVLIRLDDVPPEKGNARKTRSYTESSWSASTNELVTKSKQNLTSGPSGPDKR